MYYFAIVISFFFYFATCKMYCINLNKDKKPTKTAWVCVNHTKTTRASVVPAKTDAAFKVLIKCNALCCFSDKLANYKHGYSLEGGEDITQ